MGKPYLDRFTRMQYVFRESMLCCLQASGLRKLPTGKLPTQRARNATFSKSPDYSRGVGVNIEKACSIGVLLHVCGFDRSPKT